MDGEKIFAERLKTLREKKKVACHIRYCRDCGQALDWSEKIE